MYNYKLVIQYDGTRYDGWQRMGKDESINTIEYKIAEILRKMTGEEIQIFCGCRTEKGVHARGQVINFKLDEQKKPYEVKNYLNRYLPRDIAVISAEVVPERFHSQLNAKGKVYVYQLDTGDVADVFERRYRYNTFEKPDFKAFTTAKKSKSTVRTINSIDIVENGDKVKIVISANDFLHNMARYMIGMLLDVGNGLKKPEAVRDIMDGKDVQMSLPAESYALFLEKIIYQEA